MSAANGGEKRPLANNTDTQPPTKKVKPNPPGKPQMGPSKLWKAAREASPLLYDFLYSEKNKYPSYDVIWVDNPTLPHGRNTAHIVTSRSTDSMYNKQQHIWNGDPHALEMCAVSIPSSMKFPSETLIDFESTSNSKHISRKKKMIHPGPITRIKCMPQFPHTIATHTRHKYTFLWNTATQHDRPDLAPNSDPNTPQLILKGHREDATRALDFNVHCHFVCSGGKDTRVCVWGIDDYETCLSNATGPRSEFVPLSRPAPKLKPACVFRGHEYEVNEVLFHPDNMTSLCSVSAGGNLLYWDIRSGAKYTGEMRDIHCKGPTCLSWNPHRADTYVLTGGSDNKVNLIDIRNFKIVHSFEGHAGPVSQVSWGPHDNHFLSCSADHTVNIWDYKQTTKEEQLFFRHALHSGPVRTASFHNKPGHRWNIVSCAIVVDPETKAASGELQIWRPHPLLTNEKDTIKKLNWKQSV